MAPKTTFFLFESYYRRIFGSGDDEYCLQDNEKKMVQTIIPAFF